VKISEIDLDFLKGYLKISYETTVSEEEELESFFSAAQNIVSQFTGLTREECEEHSDLTVAVLILTADMFDRREAFMKASEAAPNKTLETILSLHDHNLL
jgi:hypothetical protein